jgi:hypothetical protein
MLVARDCNKFQDLRRPNVVQGLLEAIHRCKPTPNIAPAILRFAGRTFNAWHSALSILEDQVNLPLELPHMPVAPPPSEALPRLSILQLIKSCKILIL